MFNYRLFHFIIDELILLCFLILMFLISVVYYQKSNSFNQVLCEDVQKCFFNGLNRYEAALSNSTTTPQICWSDGNISYDYDPYPYKFLQNLILIIGFFTFRWVVLIVYLATVMNSVIPWGDPDARFLSDIGFL